VTNVGLYLFNLQCYIQLYSFALPLCPHLKMYITKQNMTCYRIKYSAKIEECEFSLECKYFDQDWNDFKSID